MTQQGYGQFCPVAKAAEVLTERWTPLVIRELLMGSRRFNDLRRGVPLISPTLLSDRLKALERAGVVERGRPPDGKKHWEYRLTGAGQELRPVIELMGIWGQRWIRSPDHERDLDAALLMWDIRRGVQGRTFQPGRVVVRFEFPDAPKGRTNWWLVLDGDKTDLCLTDPGAPVDLRVHTDVETMTRIWMGDVSVGQAVRTKQLTLAGPTRLKRRFPSWLGLSTFGGVERPA